MSVCSNCDFEFSTSSTSYEVPNGLWCEECYTKINYPDVYEEEQSNTAWIERCNKDDCDYCNTPNDDLEMLNCEHQFCLNCYDDIIKFNKCPECFVVIDDEEEPNKEICKGCYREYCDCVCYYKNYLTDEKNDLLYNALFIKFKASVNHKVIRKIIDMCESNYGYKDFHPDLLCVDDFEIENEYDNCYIVSVPNSRYNPNKPDVANNQSHTRVRVEYYNENELELKTREYVSEYIQYFNRIIVFNNLKPDIYKEVIEYDDEEEEPEKVFDNDSCPVCLECYDDDIIKKVACCGHTTCNSCYNHIIHSNNSRCPNCREVWDDATNEPEYIEWELDDIEELCDNEDNEMLNEIIDINGVADDAIMSDGYAQTLGYDDYEYYDNTKYRGESQLSLFVLVGDY